MHAFRPVKTRALAIKVGRKTKRSVERASGVPLPLRMAASAEVQGEYEMHLLREGGKVVYLYNPTSLYRFYRTFKNMAAAHVHWFCNTDPSVTRITCDLSDGDWPGLAQFSFSTCFESKVLVPDFHFFRDRGYAELDPVAEEAPAWEDRSDTIYWRGQVNNAGLFSTDAAHVDAPWVMQRLRFAMKARDVEGIDVRFVPGSGNRQEAQLQAAGLMGPYRPFMDWVGDKFAFDIDGHSNAWSNLMQRLKMGCCVLKVESQHGFRQWYYDKLVPFENYVPVKADLSDLAEQVDWVRSHDREAKAIAENGQALARSMTFDSETKAAARIIEANWR